MAFRLKYLALLPLFVATTACQQPFNTNANDVATPVVQTQSVVVNNSWIEISRGALEFNVQKVQALLGDKSSLCAVLKGDAYGHDLSLVTPIMIENQCSMYWRNKQPRIKNSERLRF